MQQPLIGTRLERARRTDRARSVEDRAENHDKRISQTRGGIGNRPVPELTLVDVILVASEAADQVLAVKQRGREPSRASGRETRRGGGNENLGLGLPHRPADGRREVEAGGTQN